LGALRLHIARALDAGGGGEGVGTSVDCPTEGAAGDSGYCGSEVAATALEMAASGVVTNEAIGTPASYGKDKGASPGSPDPYGTKLPAREAPLYCPLLEAMPVLFLNRALHALVFDARVVKPPVPGTLDMGVEIRASGVVDGYTVVYSVM
jgi:hypothetical protein